MVVPRCSVNQLHPQCSPFIDAHKVWVGVPLAPDPRFLLQITSSVRHLRRSEALARTGPQPRKEVVDESGNRYLKRLERSKSPGNGSFDASGVEIPQRVRDRNTQCPK